MKVTLKLLKAKIDYEDFDSIHNLSEYYSIGDTFEVYGISSRKKFCDFYIFDQQHLVLLASEFVEVVDDGVPNQWKLKVWQQGHITLWPDLFYREDFLENFSEWEDKERKEFEELRNTRKLHWNSLGRYSCYSKQLYWNSTPKIF